MYRTDKIPNFKLEGLTKRFNGTTILKNLNFTWNGGVLGLIGPNGAGKSTLIKILSTLIRPSDGRAWIFGKDVNKESFEVRRRIGVLHENPVFHPNLRVMSSLLWIAKLRGCSKFLAQRNVTELLNYFDIISARDSQIKELSAGMRQKYGIIHATLGNPPFIILDEPTSNLDPTSREKYEKYINQIVKEQQCNFLISSHVLGELNRICDGFMFLFNGRVALSGHRNELILKTSSQRFRIVTTNTKKTVEKIKAQNITIEQVKENEILVLAKNYNELLKIESESLDQSLKIEIYPLETEIDSVYRELSKKSLMKMGM